MTLTEPGRYELVEGEVVAMGPERSGHALIKARIWRAFDNAVRAAGLACVAYPDGMAVEIDARTVYEPDALVRCGAPLDDDAVKILDPMIVVEVLSPSSAARDTGAKIADYARLPSIRHYLIVNSKSRVVIHHQMDSDATIRTAIVRSGSLMLDPPGISITIETLFP
jgi:Uma2 family endonuclease